MAAAGSYDALMPAASRRLLTTVAAAALVVALAGAAFAAAAVRQLSREAARDQLRNAVLAAGEKIAVDFAAYDYRQLTADFKRVADESVGQFHKDYLTQSSAVADLIVKAKTVSTAHVASAAIVSATPRRATVVIALDRTISNTSAPAGQSDALGVRIGLVFQGGGWYADQVTPL
jgi:hypothetical protein